MLNIGLQSKVNVTIIAAILLLNVLDIYNTLYIIERGGHEANPIMEWFLAQGVEWFILAKMSLSTFGLLTLYKFNYILIINIILIVYIILILYQYTLILLII